MQVRESRRDFVIQKPCQATLISSSTSFSHSSSTSFSHSSSDTVCVEFISNHTESTSSTSSRKSIKKGGKGKLIFTSNNFLFIHTDMKKGVQKERLRGIIVIIPVVKELLILVSLHFSHPRMKTRSIWLSFTVNIKTRIKTRSHTMNRLGNFDTSCLCMAMNAWLQKKRKERLFLLLFFLLKVSSLTHKVSR